MRKLTRKERKILRNECLKLRGNFRATVKDLQLINKCITSITPSLNDCFENFEERCAHLLAMNLGEKVNEAIYSVIGNVFIITAISSALLEGEISLCIQK